jgi:hypothetical protein
MPSLTGSHEGQADGFSKDQAAHLCRILQPFGCGRLVMSNPEETRTVRMPGPRQSPSGSPPAHRNSIILVGKLLCRSRRCLYHHLGGIREGVPPLSHPFGHYEVQGG